MQVRLCFPAKSLSSFFKNKQQSFQMLSRLAVLCLAIGFAQQVFATTRYVKPVASGAGNGSSWGDASADLQAMINASTSGDQVWVAAGTYKSFINGQPYISFVMKEGVAIYGGFAGSEIPGYDLSLRDFVTNESILSGAGYASFSASVISNNDNGLTSSAILDGFTISDGSAENLNSYGGGMLNINVSPTIANCIFSGNLAVGNNGYGGGMYNDNASPTLNNCAFTGNSATVGGAMCNTNGSDPTLTDCSFSGNSAIYNIITGGGFGGGMYNENSDPTLTDCIFSNNMTSGNPGGGGGGGIFNTFSNPPLTNCSFTDNTTSGNGGGIYNSSSSPEVTNCAFSGNHGDNNSGGMYNTSSSPILLDCTFTGNTTGGAGGGMYNYFNSDPDVTDCTFSGNSATSDGGGMCNAFSATPTVSGCTFSTNTTAGIRGGGGMYNDGCSPVVTGCTFSQNEATDSGAGGGGMHNFNFASPTVTNCLFSENSGNYGAGMYNNSNSSPTITNCAFSKNTAGSNNYGGGMNNTSTSSPIVTNCSFSGNTADYGKGIFNFINSVPRLVNCILWGDVGANGEIYNFSGGNAIVRYSIVQGGFAGAGNLNINPLYVDAANGDLHLQTGSPAIDAGTQDNTHLGNYLGTDFDGDTRPQGAEFDMGFDEYAGVACPTITFMTASTNTGSCNSTGQIEVSAETGGTGPYMYSKDNGANYQSSATFTGLAATTYQVVIKDANDCTSTATAVVVEANPPPDCTITGSPMICNSQTGIYTAPAGMSAYNWEIVTGLGGVIIGPTTNQTVTAQPTGQNFYLKLTVTDANGCTSQCGKNVGRLDHPFETTINATPNSVCFGVMLDLSASVSASSTVSWTGSGISNSTSNPTTAVPTATGLQQYSVTESTSDGCFNTVSTNVIMVNASPSCSISGPTLVCSGSSATLDAGGGYSSYAWSNGGGSGQMATYTNITTPTSYTVTVTDANGCTCSSIHAVSVNSPPSCSITFVNAPPLYFQDTACANSTGNLYNAPGGMSAYSWSLVGNGTITSASDESSLTVTAGALGEYYLYLTVTDGNGCTSTCNDKTPIKASPTCSVNGASTACSNSTDNVYSVTTNGSSYFWSVVGDGVIVGSETGTSVSVTAGASGTYTVSVTTTLGNACLSSCSQTVTIEPCGGGTIDFSGKIIWENDDITGVKDATVNLTGSATANDLTDVNGDFLISTGLSSGSFTLKPVKNINKFNGVNAGDATAIQQHVTFINVITDPYKLVCADVNKNNNINTLDASLIIQSLLGNPAANAQFKTSWRFVPTSHTMTNPPWGFPEQRTYTAISSAQTNQDFIGMKIGDVTGDANPANFGGSQPMVLRANDRMLELGETVSATFNADQMEDLAALQFALTFDPAQLQFEEIETLSGLPLTIDNFGLYNIANGEIRAVWSQATGLAVSEAAPVFRLKFTALQSGTKLSAALHFDDSILPPLAYTSTLESSVLKLVFNETSGTNTPAAVSSLNLRVQPNPFREATTVSFTLPEACAAQLRVFDVTGRELLRMNNSYPAGENSEVLRLEGRAATGVLTCELITPFGVVTQRMVTVGK